MNRAARRIVSAALIRSDESTVVLVRPTHIEAGPDVLAGLEFPGGLVEHGETPVQALHRELIEELGAACEIGRLLAIDTITVDDDDPHGGLVLIYDCGMVDQAQIDRFVLPADELTAVVTVPEQQLLRIGADGLRAIAALRAFNEGSTIELGR